MNSAIYYPSIGCANKEFLKEALFLWDQLEFIVPDENINISDDNDDREVMEALELIGHKLVPSEEAKIIAHQEIMDLVHSSDPNQLSFDLTDTKGMYGIYPRKFMQQTWEELQKENLVLDGTGEFSSSYVLDHNLGLYMMSTLAISCAGGIKRIVTDKHDAYTSLYKSLVDPVAEDDSINCIPLLTVPFNGINLSDISFRKLLDLRSQEDALLRAVRSNYIEKVTQCGREMEKVDRVDLIKELSNDFSRTMEDDIKELKRALRIEVSKTILSKEFAIAVVGVALSTLNPLSSLLSVGALTKSLIEYKDKRHDLLKKHASAWLFLAHQKIPWY